MPSRPVTVAIVALWLLTAGWFVTRDVWPHIRSDQPPPYTIELADEATRVAGQTRWTAIRNGEKIGTIKTELTYQPASDTFELRATCTELKLAAIGPIAITARNYDDRVRVNRDGELRGMAMQLTLVVSGVGTDLTGQFAVSAEVRGNQLVRRASFDVAGLGKTEPELEPTDRPRGRVLNPMHPVPRITGLRPGQEWRQPLADPRSDILRAALAKVAGGQAPPLPRPPEALRARVLPDPQPIEWNGESHPCLVIEYRGDEDYLARTWVRVADGTVMRQEAGFHGETLVLQKE